jgi:hypothetical protein
MCLDLEARRPHQSGAKSLQYSRPLALAPNILTVSSVHARRNVGIGHGLRQLILGVLEVGPVLNPPKNIPLILLQNVATKTLERNLSSRKSP